jgi:hypothetical protein
LIELVSLQQDVRGIVVVPGALGSEPHGRAKIRLGFGVAMLRD